MKKEVLVELLMKDLIIGYVYGLDGEQQEYYFEKSPSNIANFIMLKKGHANKMILTDTLDRLVLDTYSEFINRCPDQRLLQEIANELVPLQLGVNEPVNIPVVSVDEALDFLSRHSCQRAWIYCKIEALEDTNSALKGQKKELMDYADQMGFEVVGSSEDIGIDLEFEHSGLNEVTKAIEDGKMDVLLVKRLDCLEPNVDKMLEFFSHMNLMGVELYTPLAGQIVTLPERDAHFDIVMKIG